MSLLIGEHISSALGLSAVVASKFGERIFPIVIPEGVSRYPYIVYGGLSIQPDCTKDGVGQDNTQVQVTVVGKGASETIETANDVRYELEGIRAEYTKFTVNDCTVSSIDVEYLQEIDVYAVNIVFNFKTNDK